MHGTATHVQHVQRVARLDQVGHGGLLRLAEVAACARDRIGGVSVAARLHDLGVEAQEVTCTSREATHRGERGGVSSEVANGLEDSAEHGECLSAPAGAVGYAGTISKSPSRVNRVDAK